MGFNCLVLVNPKEFPCEEASRRASGAIDVLDKAIVVDSLDEAIAESQMVVGTSVRERQITWPTKTPKASAEEVLNRLNKTINGKVSILFGRERTGLENEELDKANWQIRIPANPGYSSLNLASAIQLIAYELNCTFLQEMSEMTGHEARLLDNHDAQTGVQKRQRLATNAEMQSYYTHLERVLSDLDFIKVKPPQKLMRKIQRLYNRGEVSFEELQILRGILTATEKVIKKG